jgi:methionine sulfoxide reductase catalytic subunit
MIAFDAAHRAVHYPPDRRFRIWIKPSFVIVAICLVLIPLVAAWVQRALFGLPYVPPLPEYHAAAYAAAFSGVHGFPWWLRYAHFFNFVFLMMLIRSGLSILMDHPRLYFNNDCTPGTEWIHFTPLRVRVENQLGYKMVKWIERIEFIASEKTLGDGEGGTNEDDEYFGLFPNI